MAWANPGIERRLQSWLWRSLSYRRKAQLIWLKLGDFAPIFAIFCNLLLELQKPPAPVALEGQLCLSGKPHEFKRSLVTLNWPSLAKLAGRSEL